MNQEIINEPANSSNSNSEIVNSTIKANLKQDGSANISKTQIHTSEGIVSKVNAIEFSTTPESPWIFDVPEPGISEFPYLTSAIEDFIIYDPVPSIKETVNNSRKRNTLTEYTKDKNYFTTSNTTNLRSSNHTFDIEESTMSEFIVSTIKT